MFLLLFRIGLLEAEVDAVQALAGAFGGVPGGTLRIDGAIDDAGVVGRRDWLAIVQVATAARET